MKKRTIAIIAGGDSSELPVSLRSAQGIYSFIDKERYNLYIVEMQGKRWEVVLPNGEKTPIDRNDFSFTENEEKKVFDFAYITIHGTPGENGILQGYFDLLGIPYSSCNVLVSAMTFNKFTCNQYLKGFGIRVSESMILRKGFEILDEEVINKVGLPCFIKPNAGGSSFGVTKVKTKEQIQPAIEKAFGESDEVMIEAFMQGTEITCGCYKTKNKEVVFPITEVVTSNEFFDYDAKYNGQVDEITPARIPEETAERVRLLTSAIYDILGCDGIIRIDYIITEGEKVNMLEINTTPGMTATSFIPQQVRAAGLDIKDVKHVIHYQRALTAETFTHRNGRTARWEADGSVYMFTFENKELPDFAPAGLVEFTLPKRDVMPPSPSWAILYVGKGKRDKISRGDLAGFFIKKGTLSPDEVGSILVFYDYSYVAVKLNRMRAVLKAVEGEKIKGVKTIVQPLRR